MRKLLILVIILLLVALGYIITVRGIQIFNFKIWGIETLAQKSAEIDYKIQDINSMIDVQYPKKIDDLKKASKSMKEAKEEYLNYTNLSTDEEILKAMQQESYSIEFLWTKIGNHATSQGVNLKFEIASSSTGANTANDLNFTVDGSYIGITNFIYALENDDELNFRIENFNLLPHQGEILQATFTVRNITIQGNTSNREKKQNVDNSNNTENNNTNNQEVNSNIDNN